MALYLQHLLEETVKDTYVGELEQRFEVLRFLGLLGCFRVLCSGIISPSLVHLAQFFVSVCVPRVGSRQASLNNFIWCTLLCYLLCSGD